MINLFARSSLQASTSMYSV